MVVVTGVCVTEGVSGGGRAQRVNAVSNPILHMTSGDTRQHLLFLGRSEEWN